MDTSRQKLVQYLNEAHATERALTRVLQSQIAMTPRGSYRAGLESHLEETRDHAVRVDARLEALGQRSSPLKAVVGLAETVVGQALAIGKAPFDLLRGSGGEEKVLKNAKDACASETLEIATYTAIERLARSVGDDETADLAASIRADEERMLERVLREIPKLTEAVVHAEVKGEPSYDVTATGAADTVREAGKATKDAARKTTAASKRTAGRTRKPRAEGQLNGGGASEGDLAIPGYDTLTAQELTGRLTGLSQAELAGIESYERQHKNRATILSRIGTLRGNEPAPTGAPAGTSDDDAVRDAHQELKAAADGGDGAAAFTLWERLRDIDVAAAEGWLGTAVELGDVRAAHRLGMVLWERGEVDAAEATLHRATADPQGAYALGRLLWRERSDLQAAVHWLDRAAQADDPAAERDLGLVLRQGGDLHGAHYWLSRAAERNGEARQALTELEDHYAGLPS
jgi:ferritin-like metal-binding protein YciE